MTYQFRIFESTATLPTNWNDVAAQSLFLQTTYLRVLENSAPTNIHCQFIGIYQADELIATAMLQHLDLGKLAGFGNRDHGLLTIARNFLFKRYASKLAIIGNNMLTGQHAISFSPQANQPEVIAGLKDFVDAVGPHHISLYLKILIRLTLRYLTR